MTATEDITTTNNRYTIRFTSNDEKNYIQESILKSGISPGIFIKNAVDSLLLQQQDGNSKAKKVIAKIDDLTQRLNHMLRSEALAALELEKQAQEKLQDIEKLKEELEQEKLGLEEKLKREFEQKVSQLQEISLQKELQKQQSFSEKIAECENEKLDLKEQLEEIQAKYNKVFQELTVFKKQLEDKIKLLIKHEEQEFDLKKKVIDLEEKVKKHDIDTLRIQKLEIENAVLQERIEALKNEDKLKQQMIELQIKMNDKKSIIELD
ncbi:MAG: hypothetical protein DCC88_00080 [Spirobacillus cienkowskii]|uniref:Uncharacterized protein n=1 Tax=Spirobacillus cienkowskii TaxID=495820 RepID=A0A369KX11_9BACT|nr:MAG: hypothetical protein DCC88_00080 [Spirobacillus cienkowskii]